LIAKQAQLLDKGGTNLLALFLKHPGQLRKVFGGSLAGQSCFTRLPSLPHQGFFPWSTNLLSWRALFGFTKIKKIEKTKLNKNLKIGTFKPNLVTKKI
jgi:hypothetical protein